MVFRIFSSIILLLSVLFMPFWLSAILALAGMAYFTSFYEVVFIFLLSDLLFSLKIGPFPGVSFLIALASCILIKLFKKKLRFNS